MKNLNLRKATTDDSEFAYQTKKSAFRGYLEKSSGWNEEEQHQLHKRRFAEHDFRIIQLSGVDVGIMAMSRQRTASNCISCSFYRSTRVKESAGLA